MNYNETLLNAISTVVQGEMKHISFDKTILCTIVDDKFSSKRVYTVSDGTSKFTAYAETNTTYRKNEQVYVTIPQGDYREKKIIIGRQAEVKDANIPNDYILPLESVVDMTDNLVPPAERGKTSSILANGDIENKFIGKVDLKGSEQSDNFIYNILSVRADFKCNIEEQYKLISGMYALRLDVYVDESTSEEPEKIQVYTFQLQSSQMFGNIYHSSLFLPQEMKIDISKLKNITSIVMYICQDKEFIYGKDLGGNPLRVPTTQTIGNSVTLKDDNIFIKNINLAFGNDISKIPDNTLKIGTKDSLNYTKNNSSKMIYTSWYNKDADNRYIGFEDGIVDYDPAISEPSKQRWYDEKKYQKEFQEKYVGGTEWSEKIKLSQTSEQEEKKIKVPDVTEALQVYSLCLKQDDKYKEFRSVINSLKDTILDLQTTIGSFYAESGTEKVKPYFVGILQSIEQFKIVLNKIKGEPKDSNKVLSYYYIDYLNNYNDLFNQLVQEYDIITKGTSSTNRVSYPTAPLQNVNEIALNLKKLAKDNYNSSVDLPLEGSETGETYKSLTYAGKKLYEDLSKITGLTETGKQNLDSVLKRSKSSYDQYMRSIDKIFSELEKEIESPLSINMAALHDRFYIEKLPETEEEINALALVIKTFSEEYKEFVALNENRYCIYWYKYSQDQDAKDDIAGEHWVLVPNPAGTPSYEHPVPGMPSIVISNDRVYYSKDSTTPYQNFPLDLEKKATRLKAILFFNHEAFTSEELTFTNQDEDLNLSDADLNNTIHIELGENALEKYHMYGTNNEILNSSKAAEKRQLRVRYEDAGQKDEALIDTDVFWYVPDGDTTMLVYDATSLSQKGFRLITQSDSEYASYFEKGYACFYKRISFTEVEGKKELQVADTYFHFSIKSYYNAMATNNTIRCKIRKNNINFIAKQSFSFNSFGTNGTNYTLTVRPVSDQQALINESQEKVHNLEVEISLTDKDSNLIPAEDYNIKYFEPAKNEPHSAAIGSTGQGTKRIITGIMNDSSCLYNVYQCSVNYWSKQSDNGTTYDLSVYFPVPFSTGFYRFQGASTVIYDDYGRNPSYASYEYKLFDMTTNEEKVDNLWEIWYYNNEGIRITETSAIENIQRYLPTLRQKRDTNYYILDPKIIYVPAEKPKDEFYSVVVCLNQSDRKLLWAQPIKILQNRFNCPMLNNWDGELLIDKENNSILAATMAAGIKNSDNSFSGVLMGRVKKESSQERALTGLYGFNHGAQAYGFRENGTAFIGEAGKGRIEFDGQKGIIKSSKYDILIDNKHTQGMCINLEDGHIDAFNFKLTAQNLILNSAPISGEAYFKVGSQENCIELKENKILSIKSNIFKLAAQNLMLNSTPDVGEVYFKVGTNNNFIEFNREGVLTIRAEKIYLGSSQDNIKSYIDSQDQSNKDYTDQKEKDGKKYTDSLTYLNQQNVFNKLTDNGNLQGIYMQDNQLYINAEYIKTGFISANLIQGGILQSQDGRIKIDLNSGSTITGPIFNSGITTNGLTIRADVDQSKRLASFDTHLDQERNIYYADFIFNTTEGKQMFRLAEVNDFNGTAFLELNGSIDCSHQICANYFVLTHPDPSIVPGGSFICDILGDTYLTTTVINADYYKNKNYRIFLQRQKSTNRYFLMVEEKKTV